MRCSACTGVFHPATGQYLSEKTRLCGPCTKHFVTWVKGVTRARRLYGQQEEFRKEKRSRVAHRKSTASTKQG